jgi:hypothetical protein
VIWLWFAAPFIHTPSQPPAERPWSVTFERREQMTRAGVWCSWEAESLVAGDLPIWSAEPPEEENWCKAPGESARMVDVLGSDGPYVSVRLTDWGCCPNRQTHVRCVTYDVRTGQPATMEVYDPKSWKWRSQRLAQISKRSYAGALSWEPSAFVVGGGHVRVCATAGGTDVDIALR